MPPTPAFKPYRLAPYPRAASCPLRDWCACWLAALLVLALPAFARAQAFSYPPDRRSADADMYHAVRVPDPYRWLENSHSQETRNWLADQERLTADYFAQLPTRELLRQRLTALWNFSRCGLPEEADGALFFQRVDGLRNQPVLYALSRDDAQPRPLVDPNQLDPTGATAVCGWTVSPDGRWLAYALAKAGSDQHEWYVRDLVARRDLPERLATTLYNEVHWSPRSEGFYYARSNIPPRTSSSTPERMLRVKFHRVGDDPRRDWVLYERAALKDSMCDVRLSEDGRWLVVREWNGLARERRAFCLDLLERQPQPQWLVASSVGDVQFVATVGDEFLFQTDYLAPRGRIVAIDRGNSAPEHWREIVPESSETLIETTWVADRLVVRGLREATSVVRLYDRTGQPLGEIVPPIEGTITGFRRRHGPQATYYAVTSYSQPPRVFRYDLPTGESREFQPPQLTFDPARYATELVHYTSHDGTRIPMRITRRKDFATTAAAPTLLYGYGGFHVPLTPTFSLTHLAWLDLGGMLAVPNLRGGGEFGRPWHEAARGAKKGVAVDDFLAAAQWLIDQKRTAPDRLAIRGVSNGGMVVGAALARRPDLFAAAVPSVAPLDMLRYHRLPRGWAWTAEYGTADDPDQFRALLAYSPLHNLQPRTRYPATLVMTSAEDDRVVPAHSFKFLAALQAAQEGPAPCLLRVESQAGHGAGLSTPKLIDASADLLAFLCHVLQITP